MLQVFIELVFTTALQFSFVSNEDFLRLDVLVGDCLVLPCEATFGSHRSWKYDGVILSVNKDIVSTRSKEMIFLLENYSMQIDAISLNHEGSYKCSTGSISLMEVYVKVNGMLRILSSNDL